MPSAASVVAIDSAAKQVRLEDGDSIDYDYLVVGLGEEPGDGRARREGSGQPERHLGAGRDGADAVRLGHYHGFGAFASADRKARRVQIPIRCQRGSTRPPE